MKEIKKTNNIVIREPTKNSRASSSKVKPMEPRNHDSRGSRRTQAKVELPFDIKR